MFTFVFALIATFALFIALTGFLVERLKLYQYLCLWFSIFCCYPLTEVLGQSSTYVVLSLSIVLILVFSKTRIPNLTGALFGYLFLVTCDHLLLNLLPLLFHTSLSELSALESITFQCCFLTLVICCVFMFRKYILPRLSFIQQKEYQFSCICIIIEELIFTGIYIYLFVHGEQLGYPPDLIASNSFLFLLMFISVIVVLILISHSLYKEQNARQRLQQLETLESYTQDLEKLHKIMRTMNHDYKNLFSAAYSFIETNDLEGLKHFYEKSLHMLSLEFDSSTKELGNLADVHLPEVKGLLYSKSLRALDQNLNLKIRIDYPIDSVSMDTSDLVRILGIYLDNAIEAAIQSPEKVVFLHFSRNDSYTIWSISNSMSRTDIPLDKLCEYGFSTKGSERGIGLYTACELLKKYSHIIANTKRKNCQFIQTLENI